VLAGRGQLQHGSADASAGKKVPVYQIMPCLRQCMPADRLTGAYRLANQIGLIRLRVSRSPIQAMSEAMHAW